MSVSVYDKNSCLVAIVADRRLGVTVTDWVEIGRGNIREPKQSEHLYPAQQLHVHD